MAGMDEDVTTSPREAMALGAVLHDQEEEEESNPSGFVHVTREQEYSLTVLRPKTVHTLDEEYTAYCIVFKTSSPSFHLKKTRVWRRFSEFIWLRKELNKLDNWRSAPALPSKRFWNPLDPELVQERQDQLEKWLYTVLSEATYLSSSALHLFLQTELTIQEIQDYLQGKTPEDQIRQVWDNHGTRFNYQPHNPLHNFDYQQPTEIQFTEEEDMGQQLDTPYGRDNSSSTDLHLDQEEDEPDSDRDEGEEREEGEGDGEEEEANDEMETDEELNNPDQTNVRKRHH